MKHSLFALLIALMLVGCAQVTEPPTSSEPQASLTEPQSVDCAEKTADDKPQTAAEKYISPLDLPPDPNEEEDLAAFRERILAAEREAELAIIEEERRIIPLVDNPETLIELDPQERIWITPDRQHVVMLSRVVMRSGPLELLACRVRSKEHESILSIRAAPLRVHLALIAANARPGRPARFASTFEPATGDRIDITLRWQDEAGTIHESPAQDWVWDMSSSEHNKRPMTTHWVFSGSRTYEDAAGNIRFLADETGEIFGLSNFAGSVLDVPIRSTDDDRYLLFGCFTERIPPIDTVVTIILTPARGGDL